MPAMPEFFGRGWSSNYTMRVWKIGGGKAIALRPDGKVLQFGAPVSGNNYVSEADVPDTLTRVMSGGTQTGWQYKTADSTIEAYNAQGKLTSITKRDGTVTTLVYSTGAGTDIPYDGLLIEVRDHYGRISYVRYYASAKVKRVVDFNSNSFYFNYDESTSYVVSGQPAGNNLTSILYPNSQKKLFHYNEQSYTASTNLPNALTGITDELNNRYATYQYDTSGRVVSSEHAGGVDSYAITYNVNGTRTVTDPLGTARTNSYQTVQGVVKTRSIAGSACDACGPADMTYDSNGHVATETDWNGNVTTYTRSDPNGRPDLETSRTEASGSGVARTITTTWHSTFRLPTLITESGRTTAFTYDANGNVLTKTVTDTGTSETRVWTYTYNANGKVLTIDGPRSGSSDTTTYTYYANNDANVGKRGNINTITNAASHVTTFNWTSPS
jgi:YD repeat-containing protein